MGPAGVAVAAALMGVPGLPAQTPGPGALALYDLSRGHILHLPGALEEVSGLTVGPDDRLFAHDDELARIHEVDRERGGTVGRFDAGRRLAGDWEGVAWAGDRLFLVDSDGLLLEFPVGRPGTRVRTRRHPTGAGRLCEIEGLAWDPEERRLLLGCKSSRVREWDDELVLLGVSGETLALEPSLDVRVPRELLRAAGVDPGLDPSAVVVHPATSTLLVAAGRQGEIVELGRDGGVLGRLAVPPRLLPQLEGMAVDSAGILYLASEGAGGAPRLLRLTPRPPPGGPG
jgi:uncharacterized protein YjiK